jgi:hypothetical protein
MSRSWHRQAADVNKVHCHRNSAVAEEGLRPAVAALRDVMRQAGDDETGQAGHVPIVAPASGGRQ